MTNRFTRRAALGAGVAAGAAACSTSPRMTPYEASTAAAGGVFAHGVASGDPAATSVVLWTRATPAENEMGSRALVIWEVASDAGFETLVAKGDAVTGASRDWTVKAVAENLSPGGTYFYRFKFGDAVSPTGRTKTLPAGALDKARFAVMSCSNYPFGYFNAFDLAARQDDIDAVIHLGDYIYEYSNEGYGGEAGARIGRPHEPANECVTLADYRRRHAQYKADPSTQAMHAAHAMIAIWDDHETSNDSWSQGAENHDPATEGDWEARKRAALQAYYEWMPVREPSGAPEAFFRSFSYGDLMTIAAIETRLMARAKQFEFSEVVPTLKSPEDVAHFLNTVMWDESREMLGAAQSDFIDRTLKNSVAAGQPWRLIANQVTMAKVTTPDLSARVTEEQIAALEKEWDQARPFVKSSSLGLPLNFDAWDGYPAARERFYDIVKGAGAKGMIVVTGDTHTWWANDLTDKDGDLVGVELGTHSITSPSPFRKEFLGGNGAEYALLTNKENKDVRYLSGENHGFILLTITRESAKADYMAVDTIESPSYNAFVKASFDIKKTADGAKFDGAHGLGFKERFLF
ncbi:MAG: alkaline phosphatase D family protein [Parvularculaceae bacterium]